MLYSGEVKATTLCLIDYGKSFGFFWDFAKKDRSRNYVFITHLPSVYAKAKKNNLECYFINKLSPKIWPHIEDDLESTREVALGILDKKCAKKLFSSYFCKIDWLRSKKNISHIFIWNGQTVLGEVARYARNKYKIGTLFFEIANIPGKIFVDPWGVNASSKLYAEGEEWLESFRSDCATLEYKTWVKGYINKKEKNSMLPQASSLNSRGFGLLMDYLFCETLGYRFYSKRSKRNKQFKRCNGVESKVLIDSDCSEVDRYVFFPGQVHDDTQLIFNSNIDNTKAIEKIVSDEDLPVLVKPHPAGDRGEYKKIDHLLRDKKVYFTSENTFKLIKEAEKVYTINSTVGFEAKILCKPVTFLGRSLFSFLSEENIEVYVINYLIDADFFSDKNKIRIASVEAVYSRSEV